MTSHMDAFSDETSPETEDATTPEGITVAIRMRPLNKAEGSKQRIWKVLPKYNSITQTTNTGKPLTERITGRTFFTFDKTFGEDVNTTQVYDSVAKGIVSSVVNGLNGTIFAYGQTSSGKTYTMQGCGSIEQGSSGEGGIVHMAAKDIFSNIMSQQNRVFLVRASFLEIYNEEVRDLLSNTNQTLPIREDPRRGVFVQSVEEIVTDFESLLRILFHGEKSRAIASTGMNERSSRSHTIFRVTIESREKEADETMDGENDENKSPTTDGAVRVSTLNLVDLAGSESVRHTGATGERQKEGGMINQSLLTLSRVIVSLGNSNQGHINFRDSKLTRILQPSLSGNARMAVVCCATPSELYLEETRSTLQFASRAKLVKTNAQVNEVLDDRSTIKRLQRELAEARRQSSVSGNPEHVRNLESRAATAGTVAKEAKEKLDRLKASILNTGYLFSNKSGPFDVSTRSAPHDGVDTTAKSRKRRQSDSGMLLSARLPISPAPRRQPLTPKTSIKKRKKAKASEQTLSPNSELNILREALVSRNEVLRSLKLAMVEHGDLVKSKDIELAKIQSENKSLHEEALDTHKALDSQQEQTAALQATFEETFAVHEAALAEKEATILDSVEKLQKEMKENQELKAAFQGVQDDFESLRENADNEIKEAELSNENLRQQLEDLKQRAEILAEDSERNASELAKSKAENEAFLNEVEASKTKENEMAGRVELLTSSMKEVENQRNEAIEKYKELQTQFEGSCQENSDVMNRNAALEDELASLKQTLIRFEEAEQKWNEKTAQSESTIKALQESVMAEKSKNTTFLHENDTAKAEIEQLKTSLTEATENFTSLQKICEEKESNARTLEQENKLLEENWAAEKSKCHDLLNSNEDLKQQVEKLQASMGAISSEYETATNDKTHQQAIFLQLKEEFESSKQVCSSQEETIVALQAQLQALTTTHETLLTEKHDVVEELEKTLEILSDEKQTNETLSLQIDKSASESNEAREKQKEIEEEAELLWKEKEGHEAVIVELRTSLQTLESAMTELSANFDASEKQRAALEMSRNELEERSHELQNDVKRLEEREASLLSEGGNHEEAIHILEAEVEAVKSQLVVSTDRLGTLATEAEALREENGDVYTRLSAVEHQKSELETALRAAADQTAKLKTEISDLQLQAVELESDLRDRKTENESLNAENHDLRDRMSTLEADHGETSDQLDSVRTTLGTLQQQKSSLEECAHSLQTQVGVLETEIKQVLQEKENLISENKKSEEGFTSRINELSLLHDSVMSEKESLLLSYNKLAAGNEDLTSGVSTLQTQIASLQTECKDLTSRLSDADAGRETAETQIDQLRIENENMETAYDALVETASGMKKQIDSLEAQLVTAHETANHLISERDALINENTVASKELQGILETAENTLNGLKSEKANLESLLSTTETKMQELESDLEVRRGIEESLNAENEDIKSRLCSIEQEKSDLENHIISSQHEMQSLNESIASLEKETSEAHEKAEIVESKLAEVEGRLSEEIQQKENSIAELCQLREASALHHSQALTYKEELDRRSNELEVASSEWRTKVEDLEKANAELQLNNEHACSQLEALREKFHMDSETMSSQLSSLGIERQELESQLERTQSELKSLEATKVLLEQTMIDDGQKARELQEQLTEAQKRCTEYTEEREKITSEVELLRNQASEERAQLGADKDELQMQLEELQEAKVDWDDKKLELEKEIEDLRLESHETRNQLEMVQVNKIEMESQLMSIKSEYMEARARRDSMEASQGEWGQKLDSYSDELAAALEQIGLLTSEKNGMSEEWNRQICAASEEKAQLSRMVEELQEHARNLELQNGEVAGANQKLTADNDDISRQLASVAADKADLESRVGSIQDESLAAVAQADALKMKISELTSKINCLEETLEHANEENANNKIQLEQALEKAESYTVETAAMNSQVVQLTRTNEELAASNDAIRRELEGLQIESNDMCDRLKEFESEIERLESSLELGDERSATLQASIEAIEDKYQASQNRLEEAQRELDTVKFNLRHESSLRESLQKSLQERESERDDATSALEKEYEKNRDLSRMISDSLTKEKEAELLSEISELKMRSDEMKQLLASCNESEQRFRKSTATAEKELSQKEAELEDALYRLSQMEEELRLSELSDENDSNIEASQQSLLRQMEELIQEKASLQRTLEKEREERLASEQDLKKQMGEEQRILIQEGENIMSELRTKAEALDKRLQASEAEAYAARQQIEELDDEKKLIKKANVEATRTVADLKTVVGRLESQLSASQSDLSKIKADCYALKESSIEMKEKMRKSSRECEKATRDREIASNEVSALKRKFSNLENKYAEKEEENQQMASQLQKSVLDTTRTEEDRALHDQAIELKEEEIRKLADMVAKVKQEKKALVAEVRRLQEKAATMKYAPAASENTPNAEKLHSEVEKLRREIADKDRRIKKLKAVSLTKDQAEQIRNIRETNAKLTKDCSKLNEEKRALQTQLASIGSDSEIRTEISELRFDKKALENKLRKFAAHCQRLEDDKAGILDTLRTSNRDFDGDCDINEAIISLCDKVASLEEAQTTKSVGSNSDLQRLEQENKGLSSEIKRLKRCEEELSEKVSSYQKQVEQLTARMKDVNEDVHGVQSEMSRKLRYLEQENLQLMLDLKSTRKHLQTAREEAEMLRINVGETPTLDFGEVDLGGSSIERTETKKLVKTESSSQKTMGSKRSRGQVSDTPTKRSIDTSSSQPRKRQQLSKQILGESTNMGDKENGPPNTTRDYPPKSVPTSSKKKTRRQPAPGLGEAAVQDGDDTGECKQS